MTVMRIAVISAKGGTGKTTVAVALACYWAHHTTVLLADCDPQTTGSATWWLDRTDQRLTDLHWVKATAEQTATVANKVTADIIVIDTKPSIRDTDTTQIANAVNLVIIPGSTYETGTIAQTAKTIHQHSNTPTAAVLTRTATQSTNTTATQEMNQALTQINCPVIGQLRRYMNLEAAPTQGRRPGQLPGPAGQALQTDTQHLAQTIQQRIKPQ